MGFNNEYVTLCVNSKTINNYEKLGYEMPKKISKGKEVYDTSKTIDIRVFDLVPNSSTLLDYSCDNCGDSINVSWRIYLTYNIDGKYYCKKCKHENPKFIKWLKPRVKITNSRTSSEYNIFVRTVLKRDNYTCKACGLTANKNNMEIHHLNGYGWFIEGRTDPANGITLCNKNGNSCHENFHSIYGKIHNTKEQFEEWIKCRLENLNNYENVNPLPRVYCIEDNKIYEDRFKCAELLNCSASIIYQVCHGNKQTFNGKHYVYYNNYLKMSKDDIELLLIKKSNIKYKQPINIEFGLLFNNTKEASKHFSMKVNDNIHTCCNNKRKSAGKYNNIKLSWMWLNDYLNLSDEEKIMLIEKNLETLETGSFLMEEYNILIN